MYIDIYDYVTRYMINYIVYHSQHLRDYGDIDNAISYFDNKYNEQINKVVRTDGIIQPNLNGSKAADPLLVVDTLQNGSELEDIIEMIGWGINEGLDASAGRVDWENYEAFIQAGKSFSNLFNTGNLDSRLHEFFNLILAAMQEANLLSLNVLNALTNIGSKLTGTQFQIPGWTNAVIPLSSKDQDIAKKVIDSLEKAAAKFSAGTLTPRSFAVTITNIFTKAIGTKYYDTIIANGLAAAQQQCDSVLNQLVASGDLKWVDKGGQTLPTASSTRTNIVSSPLLSLVAVQKDGQEFEIEVANSTDITWPTRDMSRSGMIKLIGKSKVGDMFSGQPEKYWAYNIIAHRGVGADFDEAFSRIRAYTAASFFVKWVNGNNFTTPTGKKAQFLFVNGRIYPVYRIISNICNEIMRNGAENIVSIGGKGKQKNSWIGSYANIADALTRSEMVNKVINTLTIAANLNTNILTQYAY